MLLSFLLDRTRETKVYGAASRLIDSNKTTLGICSCAATGNVQSCRLLWRISSSRSPRDVRIAFSLMNPFYLCFSITKALLALEQMEGLLRCERCRHRYQQKRTNLWCEHRWVVKWNSTWPETFPLVEMVASPCPPHKASTRAGFMRTSLPPAAGWCWHLDLMLDLVECWRNQRIITLDTSCC